MNKDYTKIKLRDFRKNLSQLKDSLAVGEVFQVIERGKPFAYFVPAEYEVKLKKKKVSKGEYSEIISEAIGSIKLDDEVKRTGDYMETYRKEMIKKYLK